MDVVSVEFGVEKSGFVVQEEVITSIMVRTSCDAAEALEGLTGLRRWSIIFWTHWGTSL